MRQLMPDEAGQETSTVPHWAAVLRGLRQAAGVTQEGWATQLGYGRRTVQRWERGESVPDATATAAILELCNRRGIFRAYRQGVLAGGAVTPNLMQDLLTEARQSENELFTPLERAAQTDSSAAVIVAPAQPKHNLPAELTSFVGRELERIDVSRRLEHSRLITIVGVGGVGKTRLALCVARNHLDTCVDGVWFIGLESLTEPALVAGTVARAVGVRERAGADVEDSLLDSLTGRELLLVLDNCEHLASACAALVERLLRTCPNLRVLATSREPLGVPGEVVWRLPALSVVPVDRDLSLETLAGTEAVRLFADRAATLVPDFCLAKENIVPVAQICWRLDGIPLAIELAAARLGILSPREIAARLDDRFNLLTGVGRTAPNRQQTLRATLDWSYQLLDDQERHLFDCLSIFPGTFSLAAVEAVCGWAPSTGGYIGTSNRLLDKLAGLIAKSLVLVEHPEPNENRETRYRLLETLRTYGRERLVERGELDVLQQRHAAWVLAFVEQAEEELHGPQQGSWMRRLEHERINLQSALGWAIEREDAVLALHLAGSQAWYWYQAIGGAWTEGRHWLERSLSLPNGRVASRDRARALAGAMLLAQFQGDLAAAGARVDELVAMGEELMDDSVLLLARGAKAQLSLISGDFATAERMDEETLELAYRLGDTWSVCRKLANKAYCAVHRGDATSARRCLEESAALARQTGDTWSLAMALGELGDLERVQGAHDRASALYEESLALHESLQPGERSPSLIHNLGYVALARHDTSSAAARFTDALAQFRWRGDRRGIAESVIGLAAVAAAEGRVDTAAQLFGAGQAALEELGTQLWPSNRRDHEYWVARTRAELSESVFECLWSEGWRLSLDAAVTRALDRAV